MLDRTFGYTVLGGRMAVGSEHSTSALEEGKTSLCDVTFIRQGKKMSERSFTRVTLMKHSGPNT